MSGSGRESWFTGYEEAGSDRPDQTPTFDPAEPEPVPEYEFDQSLPEAWED